MDIELIIYLIFVGILIISRMLRKSKEKVPPAETRQDDTPAGPVKSFEELLKEFTSGRSEEDTSYETETVSQEPVRQTEQVKQPPQNKNPYREIKSKGSELKTLNELVDIDSVRTRSRLTADEEETQDSDAGEIRRILQDHDEARRAIILSEIIRRRY